MLFDVFLDFVRLVRSSSFRGGWSFASLFLILSSSRYSRGNRAEEHSTELTNKQRGKKLRGW